MDNMAPYLVAKAHTKRLLLHVMELLENGAQLLNPLFVAMGVMPAPCDHKAIVLVELLLAGKLAVHNEILVPLFTRIAQHFYEHGTVATISLYAIRCTMTYTQTPSPKILAFKFLCHKLLSLNS